MKKLFACLLICFLASALFAQKKAITPVVAISKAEFNKHLPSINLVVKAAGRQHKINGTIKIKTATKTILLKDDGELLQYRYEGALKGSQLIVIHELEPNTEEYYLINKQTGKIDTLLDKPDFFSNHKDFICLEGAGTDVKQRIQLGKVQNGKVVNSRFVHLPAKVIPESIYWLNQHTLVVKATEDTYYLLKL
jgi:hypothetical protein